MQFSWAEWLMELEPSDNQRNRHPAGSHLHVPGIQDAVD